MSAEEIERLLAPLPPMIAIERGMDYHDSLSFPSSRTVATAPGEQPSAVARLANLVRSARKSLKVVNTALTVPLLQASLEVAVAVGADVELICDVSKASDADSLIRNLSLGIQLRAMDRLDGGLVMIDDTIVISGSTIWTTEGLYDWFDFLLVSSDPSMVCQTIDMYHESIRPDSYPLNDRASNGWHQLGCLSSHDI